MNFVKYPPVAIGVSNSLGATPLRTAIAVHSHARNLRCFSSLRIDPSYMSDVFYWIQVWRLCRPGHNNDFLVFFKLLSHCPSSTNSEVTFMTGINNRIYINLKVFQV